MNVLGHFDVWHGERDLTPPRGQPADVVQLLALHDGVMHRDTLVAALWPDDAPWVGTLRLRNVLHRLRAHSGALVVRERHRDIIRYQLPVRIDLTEFLALSAQAITLAHTDPEAALEHGTQALLHYRGPLLHGQPYTDWAHAARIRAAERHPTPARSPRPRQRPARRPLGCRALPANCPCPGAGGLALSRQVSCACGFRRLVGRAGQTVYRCLDETGGELVHFGPPQAFGGAPRRLLSHANRIIVSSITTATKSRKGRRTVSELDNLLSQVEDEGLRTQLKAQVDRLTRQMRFGLVFERHLPESIRDYNAPVTVGDIVAIRAEINGGDEYTVERLTSRTAAIVSVTTRERRTVKPRELVVVKRFGEPAYPSLFPLGSIRRGDERPAHAVINGENYHALQLLRYLYRGKVDCIYIDPPYNTGNSDWRYNNRYIDNNDRWRHSKWLSFMERRLEIAKDLLKPDGVVIVTIDEHEVHHLAVLLEQIFTGFLQYTVTIVHNPKGTGKVNFSRVNEYAIYCVPDTGDDVILGLPPEEADALTGGRTTEHEDQRETDDASPTSEGDGGPEYDGDEELADDEELAPDTDVGPAATAAYDLPFPAEELPLWELRHARRRGNESGYRHQRPNQFYPLYVNAETEKVVRAGDSLPLDQEPDFTPKDGLIPLWPIDREGNERCWRYIPSSMQERIDAGLVVLGQRDGDMWTVNYWTRRVERKRYKTVWWSKQHDAGTHGTSLLPKFLGRRNAFPFPKSIYAVRDTLLSVVRDRPDALILDFFAGSGTTLHATALINEADDGRRRCLLVTNNEVDIKTARRLVREGHLPGTKKFESEGIFWQATRPRIEAAVTGMTPAGRAVEGRYAGTRKPFAEGFDENVEFFELTYLDRDAVRQGAHFEAIEPSLWLSAGGVGTMPSSDPSERFVLPKESNYGVLFQRSAFSGFLRALAKRPDVTHVFLVTDSESAYAQMCSRLPGGITSSMLYRDYLANFRINTQEAFR